MAKKRRKKKYTGNLMVTHDDDNWIGCIKGEVVARFGYYNDGQNMWLNSAEVKKSYHRQGIGCRMIERAVKYYGAVYASRDPKADDLDNRDDFDTRYLSIEGASLVNSCIKQGIMKKNWLRSIDFDDFHEDEDESYYFIPDMLVDEKKPTKNIDFPSRIVTKKVLSIEELYNSDDK